MAINISNLLHANSRKSENKSINAATSFDRPNAPKGFAGVLKGSFTQSTDRSVKAFQGNSAYTTRLGGLKPW